MCVSAVWRVVKGFPPTAVLEFSDRKGTILFVAGLRNLESLMLDINLVLVPRQFRALQKLRTFSVSGTGRVTLTIPDDLSSLPALEELKVSEPLWPDIPPAVYSLTALKSLVVEGHHQYSHHLSMSSMITKMGSLRRFGIVAHRLQRAPEEVGEMVFLEELDLSRWVLTGC